MTDTASLTLADYLAICAVQDRYTGLLDSGEHGAWLELFTDDATLTIADRSYTGREGLQQYLDSRHPHVGKHITATPVLKQATADRCSIEANFIAVKRTDEGLLVNGTGRYHDELSRQADGWRLESRRVVIGARP